MKRFIVAILLPAALAAISIKAYAYEYEKNQSYTVEANGMSWNIFDDWFYYYDDSGTYHSVNNAKILGGYYYEEHYAWDDISYWPTLSTLSTNCIVIPEALGVSAIGPTAFCGFSKLKGITIPESVLALYDSGVNVFSGCYDAIVRFLGTEFYNIGTLSGLSDVKKVICHEAIKVPVMAAIGGERVVTFTDQAPDVFYATIISSEIRQEDPTIMDIKYIVHSSSQTVNVRLLAFENGNRDFKYVVRPETFIDGTDANLGDGIMPNVEHRLSWKVSSDWGTDLSKVSCEILAMEPDTAILPLHFEYVPQTEGHPKTIFSINDIAQGKIGSWIHQLQEYSSYYYYREPPLIRADRTHEIQNALFWLYAGGDPELRLAGGNLYWNGLPLSNERNAMAYIFHKMGYRILEGKELAWVNEASRLNLQPSGFRQYAVKTVEE